jgi:hypothetical protein
MLCSSSASAAVYGYCRTLTVTNQNDTDTLYANWTIGAVVDAGSLLKFRSDFNDVRAFHFTNELFRNVTGINSTAFMVYFPLQDNITALGSDSNYKVCYGNPSATAGPYSEWDVFSNVPDYLKQFVPQLSDMNFADTSKLYDSSPQGINGSEVASTGKEKVPGLWYEGINFTGVQNVEYVIPVGGTGPLDTGSGDFAISVWMNQWDATGSQPFDSRGGTFEKGCCVQIAPDVQVFCKGDNSGSFSCSSGFTPDLYAWHQYIITVNSTGCAIYVDGVNRYGNSFGDVGDLWVGASGLHVGDRYDGYKSTFNGIMENFIFINSTITGADIDRLYYGSVTPQVTAGEEIASTLITVGFVPPTPANNSVVLDQDYVDISASVYAVNTPDVIILNWDGTNNTFSAVNGTNTFNVTSLPAGLYSYYVWVNDTSGISNQTGVYQVRLAERPDAPVDEVPYNNTGAVGPSILLQVKVTDPDSLPLTVTFRNGTGGAVIGTDVVSSGDVAETTWTSSFVTQTNYTWYVNVSNGYGSVLSGMYLFTAVEIPAVDNMHVEVRNETFLNFMWDNKPTTLWVSLYVKEAGTTIRNAVLTRDNWTAPNLKFDTVYNFSWQVGDIYGVIGPVNYFEVRTLGWYPGYDSFQSKRLITLANVTQDLDDQLVNISLDQNNFELGDMNVTSGNDIRFTDFIEMNPIAYNLTYLKSVAMPEIFSDVPYSHVCVGSWVDCGYVYDTDMNTFGSPDIYKNASVLVNFEVPSQAPGYTYPVNAHINLKDGDGYGWDLQLPKECFYSTYTFPYTVQLRVNVSYNDSQVIWQCKYAADPSDVWYTIREEHNYYHAYYVQMEWIFAGEAHLTVNMSHLDANYTNQFYMYYDDPTAVSNVTALGAPTWQKNQTIGPEEFQQTPSPVLTPLAITVINGTAINVSWNSTLTSDNYIRYSRNQWFVGESYNGWDNYTAVPAIGVTDLTTDTTWYLLAVSCQSGTPALSNCANMTGNVTLGTLPSAPLVSVLNYTEDRPGSTATVCVNLTSTDSQTVNLSVEYFYLGTPYEAFNESSVDTGKTVPTVSCFTVPVDYGQTYIYRAKAVGGSSTGYSAGYQNEFMPVQYLFAGSVVEDDNDNRDRPHAGYWEGSCQQETSMWVETNITGMGALQLRWWDGSAWSLVPMLNGTVMWYKEMTGLGQQWYTFEIWNDTAMLLNWTKPGPIHLETQNRVDVSKYVSFGCSPSAISYDLLYLNSFTHNTSVYRWCIASGGNIYECMMTEYWGGGSESGLGPERTGTLFDLGQMFRGGITNGEIYDTGVLDPNRGSHVSDLNHVYSPTGVPINYGQVPLYGTGIPYGSPEYRYCFAFLDFYWNETKIPSNGISSYYVHQWNSEQWYSVYFAHAQDYEFHHIGLFRWAYDLNSNTRDFSIFPETMLTEKNDVLSVSGNVFNASYDEALSIYTKSFPTITSVLENGGDRIYEHGLQFDGQWPNVMFGQHQQSFVIFNLPSNATLLGLDSDSDGLDDFAELYSYYTNPESADTDEGGTPDGVEIAHSMSPNIWTDDDSTAPTLSIVSPSNGSVIFSDSVTVSGTASDAHPGTIVSSDPAFVNTTSSFTSWSFTATGLAYGAHSVTITADDVLGNSRSQTVTFTTIAPTPAEVPVLTSVLRSTGSGLGGFLTAITQPTVNIVLALGLIGAIIAVLVGIAVAVTGVFRGTGDSAAG